MQLTEVLRDKAVLRYTQLYEDVAVKEGRREVVGNGECPPTR